MRIPLLTFQAGWSATLSHAAAGILLFELVSGLAITFGPFHPLTEWSLLLHTLAGAIALEPLAWYCARHWRNYAGQALSDALLLGYVGAGGLAICLISGLLIALQALRGGKTCPALRYAHLISTLLAVAATVPHFLIS